MPELPEMETYKKLLTEKIINKRITDIEVNREKSINMKFNHFKQQVVGNMIHRIERRAKFLIFHLDDGAVLLLHLMLGGWLFYGTDAEKPNRSIQVKFSFDNDQLYFIGLRLGYLHLLTLDELENRLKDLGPEPITQQFINEDYNKIINNRRGMLKTTLTNQQIIAGIGNCYSDEICFEAKLLPTRKVNDLREKEKESLLNSIGIVLNHAVRDGGYMENPLYIGDKLTGGFDSKCKVYDRAGEACIRCGFPIMEGRVSSKKTFYCNHCQF